MELWIRSQDKSSIVKVDNLYVSVGNFVCYYVEKGKEVPDTYYRPSGELGVYETKERALEVLDEIQNIITPSVSYTPIIEDKTKPSDKQKRYEIEKYVTTFDQLNVIVYQMPEE